MTQMKRYVCYFRFIPWIKGFSTGIITTCNCLHHPLLIFYVTGYFNTLKFCNLGYIMSTQRTDHMAIQYLLL